MPSKKLKPSNEMDGNRNTNRIELSDALILETLAYKYRGSGNSERECLLDVAAAIRNTLKELKAKTQNPFTPCKRV